MGTGRERGINGWGVAGCLACLVLCGWRPFQQIRDVNSPTTDAPARSRVFRRRFWNTGGSSALGPVANVSTLSPLARTRHGAEHPHILDAQEVSSSWSGQPPREGAGADSRARRAQEGPRTAHSRSEGQGCGSEGQGCGSEDHRSPTQALMGLLRNARRAVSAKPAAHRKRHGAPDKACLLRI